MFCIVIVIAVFNQITILFLFFFQREHSEILAGIGKEYRKSGFRCTKAPIYLKRGKVTFEDQ